MNIEEFIEVNQAEAAVAVAAGHIEQAGRLIALCKQAKFLKEKREGLLAEILEAQNPEHISLIRVKIADVEQEMKNLQVLFQLSNFPFPPPIELESKLLLKFLQTFSVM